MAVGYGVREVERMPVVELFARARSWRRVRARTQLDAFHVQLAATRGDEASVRAMAGALARAANTTPPGRHGDVNDLERWLTGGK